MTRSLSGSGAYCDERDGSNVEWLSVLQRRINDEFATAKQFPVPERHNLVYPDGSMGAGLPPLVLLCTIEIIVEVSWHSDTPLISAGKKAMKLGDMTLEVVSGGSLAADGGVMFGGVPRLVWQNICPPDLCHRVQVATNCLLLRAGGKTALIDTGYGSKADDRLRRHYSLEDGHPLLRHLADRGVGPLDVDVVVLTHLHFDHAGGCTVRDGTSVRPTFPRARHYVQRAEWEDAVADLPELSGAYYVDDFVPLHEAGILHFLDGEAEILPGVTGVLTGGHTRGHQIVRLRSGPARAVYLADLCPLAAHLRPLWTMAYDQFPLTTRRAKAEVLRQALADDTLLLFGHDCRVRAARLRAGDKEPFALGAIVEV
jgi:glyoxylase-like metal-dependent hydrolase (beta-lactamase superfamily II)